MEVESLAKCCRGEEGGKRKEFFSKGKTYFVVMHQSDEPSLSLNTEAALEDYIANAPAGSLHDGEANTTDSPWQKFGRNIANSTQDVGAGKMYRAMISSSKKKEERKRVIV